MQVLNIEVGPALWAAWERSFVPGRQPFFAGEGLRSRLPGLLWWTEAEFLDAGCPPETRDTLALWKVRAPWATWLDEADFRALATEHQLALLEAQSHLGRGGVWRASGGAPFVWWPSSWHALSPQGRQEALLAFVLDDRLPCRRDELAADHRAELERALPFALPLAGTFPAGSGPNCLGTVLAALGVPGAAGVWLHAPPFTRWLDHHAARTEQPDAPGRVLVWRDGSGQVQHAALGLGRSWALHKESQTWATPRQVVRLEDARARFDEPGWTVEVWDALGQST